MHFTASPDVTTSVLVENNQGLNLSVELPGAIVKDSIVSSIQSSTTATNDVNLITSNSWANLAENEEVINKIQKKTAKRIVKSTPTGRTRRGHVSNPSS